MNCGDSPCPHMEFGVQNIVWKPFCGIEGPLLTGKCGRASAYPKPEEIRDLEKSKEIQNTIEKKDRVWTQCAAKGGRQKGIESDRSSRARKP